MDDDSPETDEPQATMVAMAEADAAYMAAEEIVTAKAAKEERRREATEPTASDITSLKEQLVSLKAPEIEVTLPGSRVCVA